MPLGSATMSGCCATAGTRAEADAACDDLRRRLDGTNVNSQTFLATDYLNHFNEIVMLLDILADCPECFEDARSWQPKSYVKHFADSSLSDRDVAIEAYAMAPAKYRHRFDRIVEHMDNLVLFALRRLEAPVASQDTATIQRIAGAVAMRMQELVAMASAVIHGNVATSGQEHVDALMRQEA